MNNTLTAKAIELRIYHELSVFQIAMRLNTSIAQVETHLAKYTEPAKYPLTFQSRANLCNRAWFVFTSRDSLSNDEMAKQLGLAEPTVRKILKGLRKKKHIIIENNNAEVRATMLCFNFETGIYYRSITEAAQTIPRWSHIHAYNMIAGRKLNKTPIQLV